MSHKILLLLIVVLLPMSVNAESYLCITEHSAGFIYDKNTKEWESAEFKADSKYIVSRSDGDIIPWSVVKHGKNLIMDLCTEDFENGYLKCDKFTMGKENMRFILVNTYGFVIHGNEGEDTPNMEIGKCSRL